MPVPFTELKIWEHQVRYEVDRRRSEMGALGRFQAPYPPSTPHLFQISFGPTLLMKCLLITVMRKVLIGSGCTDVTQVLVNSNPIL